MRDDIDAIVVIFKKWYADRINGYGIDTGSAEEITRFFLEKKYNEQKGE